MFIVFVLLATGGLKAENTPSTSPSSAPRPRPLTPALTARVGRIKALTARVRGLPFKYDVYTGTQTEREVVESLTYELAREFPGTELRDYVRMMALFGYWSPDFDLKTTYKSLMSGAAAGYYNPSEKWLVVVEHDSAMMDTLDILTDATETTLAHELTHALQDQYYDLKSLQGSGLGDAAEAVTCLAEGDAIWTQYDYMYQKSGIRPLIRSVARQQQLDQALELMMNMGETGDVWDSVLSALIPGAKELAAAPRVLRESMMLVYSDGFHLVRRIHNSNGAYTLDWAFRHPPVSTEQVLHPDKYLSAAPDMPKTFPNDFSEWGATPELGSTHVITSVTLGEMGLRSFIRDWREQAESNAATAGWDGDKLFLIAPKPDRAKPFAVFLSEWDSQRDASEFAGSMLESYNLYMGDKATIRQTTLDSGRKIRIASWVSSERMIVPKSIILTRSGARVVILLDVPALTQDIWLKHLMKLKYTEPDALPVRLPASDPAAAGEHR